MPPRPSSGCRHALQSRTTTTTIASTEPVWITDDVLSRAFQRFLDVSTSGVRRRAMSSVPGPMYHRKRFGRRQLTDLNTFQTIGSMPVWALPNAPDMSRWQWQPPKPELWSPAPLPPPPPPEEAAVGPVEPPKLSEVAVVNGKLAVQFDENNKSLPFDGFMRSLKHLHTDCSGSAGEYLLGFGRFNRRFEKAISQGTLSGPLTAKLFLTAHDHLEVASRKFRSPLRPGDLFGAFMRGVKSARTVDPSFCISKPLFWTTFLERLSRLETNKSTSRFFVFAMHNLNLNQHSRRGRRAQEAALSGLDAYFRLWRGTKLHAGASQVEWPEILQASQLASMWSGRVNELFKVIESDLAHGRVRSACFNMDTARRCVSRVERFVTKIAHLMSDDLQLTKMVAKALSNKSPRQHVVLYRQATSLLGTPRLNWSRAHYNWLLVMARLPEIKTPRLKHLLDLFAPQGHAALSHTELCKILILHWSSQGLLTDSRPESTDRTRPLWNEIREGRDDTALAALALAVSKIAPPIQCTAMFWDLWNILRTRAGQRTLLRQLSLLSKRQKLTNSFLERLAWTSHDNRIALMLHHILVKQIGQAHNFWWPPFWVKFAAIMRRRWKYPLVDPILIARKLLTPRSHKLQVMDSVDKLSVRRLEQNYHQHLQVCEQWSLDAQLATWHPASSSYYAGDWEEEVRRVKSSLQLLRHAHQITDRQALDYVTAFTSILANKQGYLSARDLATLTSVIMRTLEQGKCGSIQRFKWYLGVIYRNLGEEACASVGMILKRRRQANWRIWQIQLMNTKRRFEQERSAATNPGRRGVAHDQNQKPDLKMSRLWSTYVYARQRKENRKRLLARIQRRRVVELEAQSLRTKQQCDGEVRQVEGGSPLNYLRQVAKVQRKSERSTADDQGGFDAMLELSREREVDNYVSF